MNGVQYFRNGKELHKDEALIPGSDEVRDGISMRVPAYLADANRAPPRVHKGYVPAPDGEEDEDEEHTRDNVPMIDAATAALRRPGFRFADRQQAADRQKMYDEADRELSNRWRGQHVENYPKGSEARSCTEGQQDAVGDHALTIDEMYRAHDEELANAWRSTK